MRIVMHKKSMLNIVITIREENTFMNHIFKSDLANRRHVRFNILFNNPNSILLSRSYVERTSTDNKKKKVASNEFDTTLSSQKTNYQLN